MNLLSLFKSFFKLIRSIPIELLFILAVLSVNMSWGLFLLAVVVLPLFYVWNKDRGKIIGWTILGYFIGGLITALILALIRWGLMAVWSYVRGDFDEDDYDI